MSPGTHVHSVKAVGQNGMPSDKDTRVVSSSIVLDMGPGVPTGKGDLGVGTPVHSKTAK